MRTGRPPIPKAERRSEQVMVRLKMDEIELLRRAAASAGEQISAFVRGGALARAEEELSKASAVDRSVDDIVS